MRNEIPLLAELVETFRRLPGVGAKSARRIAYHILSLPKEQGLKVAKSISDAVENIRRCSVCCNISEGEICPVCGDSGRDRSVICVVQTPQDVVAIERTGEYNGLYHVLNGAISPADDIKPSDLTITSLISRLRDGKVTELIMATSPTAEGEVTAIYISNLVRPLGIKTTRLAYGIPVGGDLEFADEMTLSRALEGRGEIG